jgi:hypothetical protein
LEKNILKYATVDPDWGELAQLEALGNLHGFEMPTISSVITMANAFLDVDFRATGRTKGGKKWTTQLSKLQM